MSIPISVRRQEGDVAAQQPEAAVDILDEGRHEAVDDVEVTHRSHALRWLIKDRGASEGGVREAPRRAGRQGSAGRRPIWNLFARQAPAPSRGSVGLSPGRPPPPGPGARGRSPPRDIGTPPGFWSWSCCLTPKREHLVGRLADLERAFGALAASRQLVRGLRHPPAHFPRPAPAQSSPACRQQSLRRAARACANPAGRRSAPGKLPGNSRFDLLVEPGDLELDALRLAHQLVDLSHRRGELAAVAGSLETFEVRRHVLKHRRFVLERLDLVVDLVERARRLEEILGIIGARRTPAFAPRPERRARPRRRRAPRRRAPPTRRRDDRSSSSFSFA